MKHLSFAGLGVGGLLLAKATLLGQAAGSQGAIHGTVTTEKGEPVEGARVEVRGLGISAATRVDGSFRLEGVTPGRYWVMVTGGGVEPGRKAITVGGQSDHVLGFHVNPASEATASRRAAEMDSLDRAFTERRKASLDGVFLTRDDIARSGEPQLGAVLANYLVQTSSRSAVRGGGTNCAPYESWVWQQVRAQGRFMQDPQAYPYVSLNGARPFRGRALYEFDPDDVEALEFYRGGGSSFGYITSSAECGLVIIWTK